MNVCIYAWIEYRLGVNQLVKRLDGTELDTLAHQQDTRHLCCNISISIKLYQIFVILKSIQKTHVL